jgi:hypothetical protein
MNMQVFYPTDKRALTLFRVAMYTMRWAEAQDRKDWVTMLKTTQSARQFVELTYGEDDPLIAEFLDFERRLQRRIERDRSPAA